MIKTLQQYEDAAARTAMYDYFDYPFVSIAEEAGEVMGKLAKYGRKNSCTISDAIEDAASGEDEKALQLFDDLEKELGDVLWQVAMAASAIGSSLEAIAQVNIAKLNDRYERNVIDGEGDNR